MKRPVVTGLPVLSSALGGMSEIVTHEVIGRHFIPGDAHDLAEQIRWVLDNPDQVAKMRIAARAEFVKKYTAESNYEMLMDIYNQAADNTQRKA